MAPDEKQALRDHLATLRTRCDRAFHRWSRAQKGIDAIVTEKTYLGAVSEYLRALEAVCDKATAPEDDMCDALDRSIRQRQVAKAIGVVRLVKGGKS